MADRPLNPDRERLLDELGMTFALSALEQLLGEDSKGRPPVAPGGDVGASGALGPAKAEA